MSTMNDMMQREMTEEMEMILSTMPEVKEMMQKQMTDVTLTKLEMTAMTEVKEMMNLMRLYMTMVLTDIMTHEKQQPMDNDWF